MTSFRKKPESVSGVTGLESDFATGSSASDNRTLIERVVTIFELDKQTALNILLFAGCMLWSLWPALAAMVDRWSTDPRYAHGYLVPIFSLALLWMRRSRLSGVKPSKNIWGLALVALGGIVQLVGGYFRIGTLEGLALLPYLGGLCLLLGGWPILNWAWPSIAFLAFMIPLPWRVENALGPPLQAIATTASTYVLQTLGFMAFAEGNVIQLNEAKIGVVEACSGLSMLITFIALSTAAALIVKRPLLDRIVLVLSSIPVALLANIARITFTGILHDTVGGHAATTFYHDLAGWLMIPLALLMYWFEVWILSRLLIETKYEAPQMFDLGSSGRPAHRSTTRIKGHKPSVL
jgi:exosortase